MGLTYWTSINFIFFSCLHLSLQEASPTEILPWFDENFFGPHPVSSIGHLPEAEDVSTQPPAWLLDNELQFPDQSQTERNMSSDLNHEKSSLESEQLQTNISLLNKTLVENETVQSITPTYVLTDMHLTEVAIEEPPTVPLVMGSQLSTSHRSEISSEFSTSVFSTASSIPLDPIYEAESSLDESFHYPLKESDIPPAIALSSSSPSDVSDVPLQPYIWDISQKTSIALPTQEEETITETQSFMTHKKDDQDEFLATETGPLVNSEMSSKKIIEDSTIQYKKETDEVTFSLAMAENITGKNTYGTYVQESRKEWAILEVQRGTWL